MGQKVNPHGLRVGVIKDWDSRWFVSKKDIGDTIVEDYRIREYIKKNLFDAGIARTEIERDSARVRVIIHAAKPGVVIGRAGAEIAKLEATLSKMTGKTVKVNIEPVKTPDTDAQLAIHSATS